MKNSKFFNLNKFDFIKGALLATFTSVLTYVYTCVDAGSFDFDYKLIIKIGVISFVGYILKNVLTNKDGKPLTAEEK